MNIDFLLYTPPKVTYDVLSLWGEVVFIPKKERCEKDKWQLVSFLNCYRPGQDHIQDEVKLSVNEAQLETNGIPPVEAIQMSTKSKLEEDTDFEVRYNIPCLYLNSLVNSKYLMLYFHASGQDIKLSYPLMNHLRNLYQINVVAMEYPGYSIYKGSARAQRVNEDAQTVYDYLVKQIGFSEDHIIVMGRSIGSGTAISLACSNKPAALVLISAFTSIKDIAREKVGSWSSFLINDEFNNLERMGKVKCPLFMLHGKNDTFIPYQNTLDLAKFSQQNGNSQVKVQIANKMTHGTFDYYSDLSNPLREFLLGLGLHLYDQGMNGPEMPSYLFKHPLSH